MGKVDMVLFPGGKNKPGHWFAATASVFRNVRAEKNVVNAATRRSYFGHHVCVNLIQRLKGNHLSVDYGLVGDDIGTEIMPGQFFDGQDASWQKDKLRPVFDVRIGILVDDSVSVDKDGSFVSPILQR